MNALSKRFFVAATAGALMLAQTPAAFALPAAPAPDAGAAITQARGGYHGGAVVRPGGGYHGGYHGGYRPGRAVVVTGGGWRRPYYGWRPGGAIAAGAAIGFLTAATAAAYASSAAPGPGLCWYYTDASYSAGFWDNCP